MSVFLDFLFGKPKEIVTEPKRTEMPAGWKLLKNDFNYAYRRSDGWVNHSFKTPQAAIDRAWDDFKNCNYRDEDGNIYKECP